LRGRGRGDRPRPPQRTAAHRARLCRAGHRVRTGRGRTRTRARLRRGPGGGVRVTAAAWEQDEHPSSWQTIRRGLALSPELRVGLGGTLALSVLAMVGRVAVPIAVQQVIDRGLRAPGGPDLGPVFTIVSATGAALAVH